MFCAQWSMLSALFSIFLFNILFWFSSSISIFNSAFLFEFFNLVFHLSFNPINPGVLRRDRFLGGGLKDPQPSTGLTPVRFLRKSHHLIRSLSWVTVQKMEWISSKMRKIWGFEFLDKSLKLRKFFKFIKEKSGGAILKVPPFCARCTDFAQIFFKSCRITK